MYVSVVHCICICHGAQQTATLAKKGMNNIPHDEFGPDRDFDFDPDFADVPKNPEDFAQERHDEINTNITNNVPGARFFEVDDRVESRSGVSLGIVHSICSNKRDFLAHMALTPGANIEIVHYFADGRPWPGSVAEACSYVHLLPTADEIAQFMDQALNAQPLALANHENQQNLQE